MSTQYYVVTHGDLDGIGCEIVARRLYENPIVIRTEAHVARVDEVVEKMMSERRSNSGGGVIVIADVCPSEEILKKLDSGGNAFVYDHHATAAGPCYKYAWAHVDQGRCGARLMYDEEIKRLGIPINQEMDIFLRAVDAYDRWQLSSPDRLGGENLNYLFRFIGGDRMVRRGPTIELDDRERWTVECLKESIARDAQRVVNASKEGIDDEGNRFVTAVADVFTSDVADAIIQAYPDSKYLLLVNPMNGSASIRVRNAKDIDASKLAKKRGGGGHPEAAGYPLKIDVLKLLGAKPAL